MSSVLRASRVAFAAILLGASAFVGGSELAGCGGDTADNHSPPDAASDGNVAEASTGDDTYVPPTPEDASKESCTLDNGTDPVGLCIQKMVLSAEHSAAFTDGGVASSWDIATRLPNGPHDFHDDAAYARALADYYIKARVYGDTELLALADGDMIRIADLLQDELKTLPVEYGGELYDDLRGLATGLRNVNENDRAAKIDAVADAYGQAIATTYYQALGASDAGAVDASSDAGDGGPPIVDGILGTAQNGHVAYDAAAVATGAMAMIDMVVRHAGEASFDAVAWQREARGILEHLHARARDAQTGLYFSKLVTSSDPVHDAIAAGPPGDTLETDTQATLALAFVRAQDVIHTNATLFPSFNGLTISDWGVAILGALNSTSPSLWDTTPLPTNDAGSGYFEGYVSSTSTLVSTKSIRSNALLFAAIHRANLQSSGVGQTHAYQLQALRALFTALRPAKSSFLTQVLNQESYLVRTSQDLDVPGDGGASYSAAANHVACEGLNEQWIGVAGR